jgi:DNA-binding winged helix-turn-helix (wHTH) protein/tetratricopeptide (TPR) repeat protein
MEDKSLRKSLFFFQKTSDAANMAVSDPTIYEFADFRLIPGDNLLLHDGESIPLPPKAFSTLVLLVEHHGHLVRKDELIETIWADAFVEEAAVSRAIWTIRNALGDDSKNYRFIQTVPKRGYKFVADVSERRQTDRPEAVTNRNGESPSVETRHASGINDVAEKPITIAHAADEPKRFSGWKGHAVLAAVLLTISTIILYLTSTRPPTLGAGSGNRIAVLPLKPTDVANRSNIHEIGVVESLIHRLNSTRGFVVRPLSATLKYDALDQNPIAAGREQKVDYVLASNYQLADGKFRMTAQLISVASGQIEDSYKVETEAGSIFAIQNAVDEIAKKLISRFESAPVPMVTKRGTSNEEAYRFYLHGRNLTMKRNRDDHRKAIENFEQAIRLDPNFALAYARMAHAYISSNIGDKADDVEKAKELVKRALELDPNLAEAYVSRGNISLSYESDFAAAERDFLRAIELEPNNDTAHWLNSMLVAYRGRFDDALRDIETAQAIDPGAVAYMFHRGRILYYARRYDEAIAQYEQAIDLDDRFMQPYGWMVRAYEIKGDYESAYQSFLKREERSPRKDQLPSYQKAFQTAGWIGVRRNLSEFSEFNYFDMARLSALHGEKDPAFEYLNKAIEKHEWLMITLNVEPAFDSLRDDPRFGELLTRVGFK